MPAVNQSDIGHLTIFALGTPGWEGALDVISIAFSGASREAIATWHLATAASGTNVTGNATFVPAGITDAGQIDIEFALNTAVEPPLDDAVDTLTVTMNSAQTGNPTFAASGFFTSWEAAIPSEKMTGSATFKIDGGLTHNAGSV